LTTPSALPRARFVAFAGRFTFDGMALAVAALFVRLTPAAPVVERDYSNGIYPGIDSAVRAVTGPLPFALGDVFAVLLAIALLTFYARAFGALRARGVTGWGLTGTVVRIVARTAAVAAILGAWFLVSWGYGYSRVSLADKVPVHNERTNEDSVTAFADHVVDMMNRESAAAHAELPIDDLAMAARLRPPWLATIHRLGDAASFAPYRPKPTLFDRFMTASGTTGFTDPWTHEVNLASSVFPFERPALYAHEWSHLAGFSDETEANYIAVIACTTSHDPLLRYSGWLLIWFNLPSDLHPTHTFTRQPYDDITAVRARYLALVKPQVQAAAHDTYDHYLKANHVKAGYDSYRLFVRWLTGADYDAGGLPIVRTAAT